MTKKKKVVITVLAVLALGAGAACGGYATRKDGQWFRESDIAKWHWSDPVEQEPNDDGATEIQDVVNE